jgi:hypothetical protein
MTSGHCIDNKQAKESGGSTQDQNPTVWPHYGTGFHWLRAWVKLTSALGCSRRNLVSVQQFSAAAVALLSNTTYQMAIA